MTQGSWRARKQTTRLWRARFLSNLSTSLLAVVVFFLLVVIGSVVFFASQIPSPQDLINRAVATSTKIYDRNGQLLYDIYQNQNRTPIKLADIPDNVKKATISI